MFALAGGYTHKQFQPVFGTGSSNQTLPIAVTLYCSHRAPIYATCEPRPTRNLSLCRDAKSVHGYTCHDAADTQCCIRFHA